MASWLAPFVSLAVVLLLYFTSPKGGTRQQSMREDINFYLVGVFATAIVAIIAGARYDRDWLDLAAWIVAGVASAAMTFRSLKAGHSSTNDTD